MTTPRKPVPPTTEVIDVFCARFDELFCRRAERAALRQYLIGLLLPREHHKTVTGLAALVPGAERQRLHHFLHAAPWDAEALNRRRLAVWRAHPEVAPHTGGVLIIDETGDPKRGHRIALAANQYIGRLGHTANGVVAVTTHWTDGHHHVPLGVKPYRPAARLTEGKSDATFRTKPELAWELIQEAQAAGIPFGAVVADCIYGENAKLEARLFSAGLKYILAIRPGRGTWQVVEDEANPPAFTPAEAARRVPREQWQRTGRTDSHGKELVHYVAELSLGTAYGPEQPVRLIAATDDPATLDPDGTWYMTTNGTKREADPAQVYCRYCLRDWIEHFYKPAKHELGWADFQVRSEAAIVRHWLLVMLAFTFSLLFGGPVQPAAPDEQAGGKISGAHRLGRDAAAGPPVALPLGPAPYLLAALVHGAAAAGTGRTPPARRPLASACCPNLTNQRLGVHTLVVSAADLAGNPANQTLSFTVVHTTSLAFTSSGTLPIGTVAVTAKLADTAPIGAVVPAGLPVAFRAGGQAATGTTDANGAATATLVLGPGKYTLTASFGGQDGNGNPTFYLPYSASAQTLYVYQPTQFVIWGGNPSILSIHPANVMVGQDYVFWGSQWAKQVQGGNFQANSSFKGYANAPAGSTWTADTGNASGPPATVSSYIGVIVATSASKKGNVESGNVAETVVVQVDNPTAYQPEPGHSGSGVMVAVVQ